MFGCCRKLNDNQLSSEVPSELGLLTALTVLYGPKNYYLCCFVMTPIRYM